MPNPSDKILAIDIGGSHLKATILSPDGKQLKEYERIVTPKPANPKTFLVALKTLIAPLGDFDLVSVGFPGFVKNELIKTAPNLGTKAWKDVNFAFQLQHMLGKPVRLINDADMQGLAVVSGNGLEMMITLGTGFGTAILKDGVLLPHFEIAHHPVSGKKTYDEYVGQAALDKIGTKKWNARMKRVIDILEVVFNYDRLYIGGGNSSKLKTGKRKNISIVDNKAGIHGGAKLWAGR